MPRHRLVPLALVGLAAITSIHLTGCTAIGFGAGALGDMSHGKGPANRLVSVRTGTSVTIWLRDGRKLHGRFLGSRDSLSETPLSVRPIGGKPSTAPLRAVLILATHHGVEQIPTDDVRRVSVPVVRGKVIGLVGGLSVDALMIVVALASLSHVNYSL